MGNTKIILICVFVLLFFLLLDFCIKQILKANANVVKGKDFNNLFDYQTIKIGGGNKNPKFLKKIRKFTSK
jgi:hypothetical protein